MLLDVEVALLLRVLQRDYRSSALDDDGSIKEMSRQNVRQ